MMNNRYSGRYFPTLTSWLCERPPSVTITLTIDVKIRPHRISCPSVARRWWQFSVCYSIAASIGLRIGNCMSIRSRKTKRRFRYCLDTCSDSRGYPMLMYILCLTNNGHVSDPIMVKKLHPLPTTTICPIWIVCNIRRQSVDWGGLTSRIMLDEH